MTAHTETPAPTVLRADSSNPLVSSNELPSNAQFIDGQLRPSSSHRTLDVVDPCSEEILAQVPDGTVEDVDVAVAAAVAAQHQWGRLTPKERSLVLLQIAERVEKNRDMLVRLDSAYTGKPLSVSRDDIDSTVDTFRFFAGAVRAITSQAAAD